MALATIITSSQLPRGTHGRLEVLVHMGGHRGRIRPAVDVVAVEELMLVVKQGLLGQAVLVGHHLIPVPGSGGGWGAVVVEGVQGSTGLEGGLGAGIVDAGRLVVHLVVLGREVETGWGLVLPQVGMGMRMEMRVERVEDGRRWEWL